MSEFYRAKFNELFAEFTRYLVEHPEFAEQIPEGAEVVYVEVGELAPVRSRLRNPRVLPPPPLTRWPDQRGTIPLTVLVPPTIPASVFPPHPNAAVRSTGKASAPGRQDAPRYTSPHYKALLRCFYPHPWRHLGQECPARSSSRCMGRPRDGDLSVSHQARCRIQDSSCSPFSILNSCLLPPAS